VALAAGVADLDVDGQTREPARDVGADEWLAVIFADGFESGSTSAWAAAP